MIEHVTLSVAGMTCSGCENAVRRSVMKLDGVEEVSASHADSVVSVRFEGARTNVPAIRRQIEALGYRVSPQDMPGS